MTRPLIPRFIQENFKKGIFHGEINAYALFVDLSGFTALTESLMKDGIGGAERLSVVLNDIFSPLVHLVYARGGFIPYFAGDAFCAIFPEKKVKNKTEFVRTAFMARELFIRRGFSFEQFSIGIKSGISYGRVEWGITGDVYHSFYFRGEAIDNSALCQMNANQQEIIFDDSILENLDPALFSYEKIEKNLYQLKGNLLNYEELDAIEPIQMAKVSPEILGQFFADEVATYEVGGEFRQVVTIFISFEGISKYEELNEFSTIVLKEIASFSGYFKEIDFGDKGGMMVAFFGAPVSYENNAERAMEFLMAVKSQIASNANLVKLKIRAGVTLGTAYTGLVGGAERCQYACVGNRVNLAARLATKAAWSEFLVDEEIAKLPNYSFKKKGDIKYKGVLHKTPTWIVEAEKIQHKPVYDTYFVEREDEIVSLFDFAKAYIVPSKAGICYLFGEAGIGKSRLMYEFRSRLGKEQNIKWIFCQSDQILKKPFNAFIYFLRNYFNLNSKTGLEAKRIVFNQKFDELSNFLFNNKDEKAGVFHKELIRTKDVLAALVGLDKEGSLWSQLSAKGRFENTIQAILNLILSETIRQPLIIEMEDGHWLDTSSNEILKELVREMPNYPYVIYVTSRFADDGTANTLIDAQYLKQQGVDEKIIMLPSLPPKAIASFAEKMLGGEINKSFYELLLRASNSNPFYLEQILKYFIESKLIHKEKGKWAIKDKSIQLSTSINAILTARIDRLSSLVKETVKAAAVIGLEFEVPVLSAVMEEQKYFETQKENHTGLLRDQIQKAEQVQIWRAMNELRYIFRHALLREAVYGMQLHTRLKQLHRLIAEAIERLYPKTIAGRYTDLAFHYENGGVKDKTIYYLKKAADYARENFQNKTALKHYNKLLEKLKEEQDLFKIVKILIRKGQVLRLIGKWEESKAAFQEALVEAEALGDKLLVARAYNNLGNLQILKGAYQDAHTSLNRATLLFEELEDQKGIIKVFGYIGELNFRQGKYDEAKAYFEKSLHINESLATPLNLSNIVSNLALTYMNKGEFDKGISVQEKQMELAKKWNDKKGLATLYTNTGIILLEKGSYGKALLHLEQGLNLTEELGDRLLNSICIGCMGSVYQRQGEYKKAMEYFQRDLEICEELGDKQGIAIALGLIGDLLSIQGDFHKAIEYLQKNLMLCEELSYKKGMAKAVNTLGDIFYFTKEYKRALEYYDRAISLTREIDNKLVLCASLLEKGLVLIRLNDIKLLKKVHQEAYELAYELDNSDLIIDAEVLKGLILHLDNKTDQGKAVLMKVLSMDIDDTQQADTYFALHRITGNKKYGHKALDIYIKTYDEMPKYYFKERINLLKAIL